MGCDIEQRQISEAKVAQSAIRSKSSLRVIGVICVVCPPSSLHREFDVIWSEVWSNHRPADL